MRATELTIPAGDPGVERTLREMRRVALAAAKHPEVIDWAHAIVRHVPERDPDAEAGAFLAWVRNNVRYTHDPVYVEMVKTPQAMMREFAKHGRIVGDCDDQVTLIAAGLNIVGVETRFAVVAAQEGTDEFSHVLIEYLSPRRGWVSMDPIVRGTGLGWFPPSFSRVGRYANGRLGGDGVKTGVLQGGPANLVLLAIGLWLLFRKKR
jgi:transglutaminase-like putative cysteine protease